MQKTILLTDDDPDYLFQMKMKLEKMGFAVIQAEGQKEAERILDSVKPDLAILDLMMETEDSGFVLAYKLKKKYPDVPVIIATAVAAETGMHFESGASGNRDWIKADLFLDKGIRSDQLHKEIKRLLHITE